MPRRRKTTAASDRRRPRARMPDGDEGKDLSEEQKAEKLQVLLSDFDAQVAQRIKQMESEAAKHLQQIENITRMEILKTPKNMLDLEIDDLIETNGSLDQLTVLQSVKKKAMEDYATSLDAKYMYSSRQLDTISENEDADSKQTTVKKNKKVAGGRRKGTLKVNNSLNMPPPTTAARTRRTTRQQEQDYLMTPGGMGPPSASGWETPLVTPKFDPRLPMTPAVLRNPKPGERTVTLSLAGSPLANRTTQMAETGCSIPLRNNKTLVLNEFTDADDFSAEDVGPEVIEKLRRLHEKLGSVIKNSSKE